VPRPGRPSNKDQPWSTTEQKDAVAPTASAMIVLPSEQFVRSFGHGRDYQVAYAEWVWSSRPSYLP
jgi:hypothetical protein